MTDALYFSYGSNMLDARLVSRCPDAKRVGVATAAGFRLDFAKRGKDGSGKATLVEAGPGFTVYGVVYQLNEGDIDRLDGFEGPGYERRHGFGVVSAGGQRPLDTFTYIARINEPGLLPFDWYVALILAGARQHGIDPAFLGSVKWMDDPEPTRTARLQALNALAAAGIDDVGGFLRLAMPPIG